MINKSVSWLKMSIGLLGIVSAGLFTIEGRAVEIIVPRVEQAPKIDGVLDDAAWKGAVVAKDFKDIKTGTPAQNQTEVKILMTDEGLYFGATLFDPDPAKLVSQERPHDAKIWKDDDFEIFLYPTCQEGEYYQFLMNPSGSREDYHGPKDIKWNANPDWQLAVSKDTKAWYAEVFVPFGALGMERPAQGTVWWLRLSRGDMQHNHDRQSKTEPVFSAWVMAPGGRFNAPEANGDLVFISRNLVVNGSFEDGPAKGTPAGWKLTVDYPEQNKGDVLWDPQVATDGKRAIILQADRKKGGVDPDKGKEERGWVELSQELPLRAGGVYQLTADVRQFDKESRGQGAYIWFGDQRLKLYPDDKMQSITLNYVASNAVARVLLRFRLWGHNPNPDSRVAIDKVVVQEIQETLEEGLVCLTGNSIQHPKRNLKIPGTYSIFNGNTTSYDAQAFALKASGDKAVMDHMLEEWLFGNVVPFEKGQLTNGKGGRLSLGNPGDTRYQIQIWWVNRTIGGTVVCDLKKDYTLTRVKIAPSTLEISADLLLKTDDGRTYVLVGRRSGNGALTFDKLNMRARWVAVTARAEGLKQIEIWGREDTAKAQLPVPYEWPAVEKPKDEAPAAVPTFTDVGIYPQPQEVKVLKDTFLVNKDTPLVLVGGKPSERSRTTLQTFQADLAEETGLRLTTQESNKASEPSAAIRMSVRGKSPELDAHLTKQVGTVVTNEQGYTLLVDPKTGIWLAGADEAGMFYGTQALLDLFKKQEAGLSAQAVAIRDWPRATLRGIMYKPTPNPFNDRFIRHIARLRYNALGPFLISAVSFVENNGTNAAQKMIAHCDRYFVQVIPSLCCVGMQKGMVQEKRADEPTPTGTRCTMCISDEGNRKEYLRRLNVYAPFYNSKYFSISLDEIDHTDQGARWNCCPQCLARKMTTPDLYAEWIKKVCAHLRSLGKTPMCSASPWFEDPFRGLDKLIKDDIPVMITYASTIDRRQAIKELGCKGFVQYSGGVIPLQDNEIGGFLDNWSAHTPEGMAEQGKFAMYIRVANGFWAMSLPPPAECEPQVGRAMARLRAAVNGVPEPSLASRPEDFAPLDLSKQANETLVDEKAGDGQGWMDEGPGRDLRALPTGKQTFLNIPFVIGNKVVMIENRDRLGRILADTAPQIPVNAKAAGIVFIHTQNQTCDLSQSWYCMMTYLGHYKIHYADGTYALHELRYGVNIHKWDTDGRHSFEATVAWKGQTALGYPVTLYLDEWVNPYPEKTITTIDFCATKRPRPTRLALLAATAIQARDYNTTVNTNRPALLREAARPTLPEGLKPIPTIGGNYAFEGMSSFSGGLVRYERVRYTAPGEIVMTASNTWARNGEPHLTQTLVDNNWHWEANNCTALTVTFPAPRAVKALEIISCYEDRRGSGLRPQDIVIEASSDGIAFTPAAEIKQTTAELDGRIPVVLSGQPIKALRIIPIRRNNYKYGTIGLAYLAMYE